jgi:hypothetical protein
VCPKTTPVGSVICPGVHTNATLSHISVVHCRGALSLVFLWLLAVAAKKGDDVKDFVAALGAKHACKYVESVNALRETLRAEKDGTKALQKRLLAALNIPPALTAVGWTAKGVLDRVLPYLDVRSPTTTTIW